MGKYEPKKADRIRLKSSDSLDHAMRRIFASCHAHWLANEGAAAAGDDAEGLHQLRVGIRRFRSAISVFAGVLPADDVAWLRPKARATLNNLNAARDWDVFIIEMLPPVIEAPAAIFDAGTIASAARERRSEAYEVVRAMLASSEYRDLTNRVSAWVARAPWSGATGTDEAAFLEESVVSYADRVLAARFAKVLERDRDFASLAPDERHKLRIALKKLRYGVEFFAGLYERKSVAPFVKALKGLQDDFGRVNDIAVTERLMAELATAETSEDAAGGGGRLAMACGFVAGWWRRELARIEPKLHKDWQRFIGKRPFWGA